MPTASNNMHIFSTMNIDRSGLVGINFPVVTGVQVPTHLVASIEYLMFVVTFAFS